MVLHSIIITYGPLQYLQIREMKNPTISANELHTVSMTSAINVVSYIGKNQMCGLTLNKR